MQYTYSVEFYLAVGIIYRKMYETAKSYILDEVI